MWKLLTDVIANQIYAHLDQEKLLPEEQKRCSKSSRRTNDLLYIDMAIMKEVKFRNKNLAMASIDYKKTYDMVPHLWIMECFDFFGVAENIKSLPDGKVIKSLQEGESYKYLGILEADKFLEEKMKLNVSKEYIRRIRKVFQSKLNGGNLVDLILGQYAY